MDSKIINTFSESISAYIHASLSLANALDEKRERLTPQEWEKYKTTELDLDGGQITCLLELHEKRAHFTPQKAQESLLRALIPNRKANGQFLSGHSEGGRELIVGTREKLEAAIEAYFQDCRDRDAPLTMAGLAHALGTTRQTIHNYGEDERFFDLIKRARTMIEASLEEKMCTKSTFTPGQIFAAKQYGYRDKVDDAGNSRVTVIIRDLSGGCKRTS